jgi:hypothetical protein
MTALWLRTIYMVIGALAGALVAALFGLLIALPFTSNLALGASIGALLGAMWPDRNRIPILGWIACMSSAPLGWVLGVAAGMLIHEIGELMCPDDARGWKGCTSPRFFVWEGTATIGGFAVGCFSFVLFPALALPSRRRTVAFIALSLQTAAAISLRMLGAPIERELLTVLLLSGIAALGLVHLLTRSARTPEPGSS